MRINTKAYGIIDVDERQQLHFPQGILGFENLKDFILLDSSQPPFYWLQSRDVAEIAFVLIDPSLFRPEYYIDALREELEEIGLQADNDENMLIFTIVTIPDNHSKMTANLQGPLVINRETKQGKQLIMTNPEWKVRHYIMDELSRVKENAC